MPDNPNKVLTAEQLRSRREIELPRWIYVLLIYCIVIAFFQGGWSKALYVYLTALALSVLFALLLFFTDLARKPVRLLAALLIVATLIWFYLSDSYRYRFALIWDVLAIVGGGFGIVVVARWGRSLAAKFGRALPELKGSRLIVGFILGGWVGLTIVSSLRASALPVKPERFAEVTPEHSVIPEQVARYKDLRVGVALSGGGYRAAVFHTGTLEALERLGIRPAVVSAVSGGAIIGSYYALGGDLAKFREAVGDGTFNLKRELLMLHNTVRLLAPLEVPGLGVELFPWYRFSRLDVQRALLAKTSLDAQSEWPSGVDQPELMLAASDLAYGFGVGFFKDGMLLTMSGVKSDVYRGGAYSPERHPDLLSAVAISGAFPMAFPATQFKVSVISEHGSGTGKRTMYLSDGGVADNLGTDLMLAAQSRAHCPKEPCDARYQTSARWDVDAVIASDAGAIGVVATEVRGIQALSRVFDIGSTKGGAARMRPAKDKPYPISVSATTAFSLPDAAMLFALESGERTKDKNQGVSEDTSKIGRVRLDLKDHYPEPVLQQIINLLEPRRREHARRELAAYTEKSGGAPELDRMQRLRWYDQLNMSGTPDNCRRLFGKTKPLSKDKSSQMTASDWIPGVCEALGFREVVRAEIRACVLTFRQVDTLDSWLTKEQIDKLHRLSQLLVYIEWPWLRRDLDAALAKSGSLPQPGP
ncbi:MAG: patatin-like phospholipase family protein [Pseudomonadota bacterium]|nr:patatin-like phospholipase family protein [Pseudomonadota bacterium]